MSDIRIPPALDRHLVSTVHTAATAGDRAFGAFDAVVTQVVQSLREQGADDGAIGRALRDVFAGLAHPYRHTTMAARYASLERHALEIAARLPRPSHTGAA
jgi:hypothetical protein